MREKSIIQSSFQKKLDFIHILQYFDTKGNKQKRTFDKRKQNQKKIVDIFLSTIEKIL